MGIPAVCLDKSGKSALDGGLCLLYIRQDASYLTSFAPAELQRIVEISVITLVLGFIVASHTTCVPPHRVHIILIFDKIKINISFYPLF